MTKQHFLYLLLLSYSFPAVMTHPQPRFINQNTQVKVLISLMMSNLFSTNAVSPATPVTTLPARQNTAHLRGSIEVQAKTCAMMLRVSLQMILPGFL